MTITEIINRLQNYDGPYKLTLHAGADESLLQTVENAYEMELPDDFKEFYRFTNGLEMDADIFNMIPLEEVIESKKRYKKDPFYIAEYMIYSEMWELEVNPENCNDYKIIVLSEHGNKLVLSNSLAEFIERFLSGGVFDDGGLYEWHTEVESQSIYPTSPNAFCIKLLLTIFYYGLVYSLVSRKEVIDWADEIIISEDEPNYFFIEISLCHDADELISILNKMLDKESGESIRAIFGLLYYKVLNAEFTVNKAISVIDKCNTGDLLTRFERAAIAELTDKVCLFTAAIPDEELKALTLKFLAHYKAFSLGEYEAWYSINYRLEKDFESR